VPTEAKRETEEILNAILPPKEWEEEGQIWTQKVTFYFTILYIIIIISMSYIAIGRYLPTF
jgi:hypothetical protein